MSTMSKKELLRLAIILLTFVGLVMFSIPFLKSLWPNAQQENNSWVACELSTMAPGSTLECGRAVVYRRTDEDRAAVTKYLDLLVDPDSVQSKQPEKVQNRWRSENPDFFIFMPWAPTRGCGVTLNRPGSHAQDIAESEALKELAYFREPCDGRTWDTSGRLYKRPGYPPEKNLIVPQVKWISKTRILVYIK